MNPSIGKRIYVSSIFFADFLFFFKDFIFQLMLPNMNGLIYLHLYTPKYLVEIQLEKQISFFVLQTPEDYFIAVVGPMYVAYNEIGAGR